MGFKVEGDMEYDPAHGLILGFNKHDGTLAFSTLSTFRAASSRLLLAGEDKLQLFPVGCYSEGPPKVTLHGVVRLMTDLYGLVPQLARDDDTIMVFVLTPREPT